MRAVPPGILPVISIDRASGKPLYRQLYEGYRDAIAERRLRAGQRLPSTRSLAGELKISRIPVLNAFEQLLAEGYFETRVGSGTFVARSLPGELLERARRSPLRAAPTRRAPRPITRAAARLVSEEPGRWFKGRGAFNVGEPALDRFPIGIWSNLVARHCRRATRRSFPTPTRWDFPLCARPSRST
jgi:GntR family transcriptional regulator/MocR family aminotransferase